MNIKKVEPQSEITPTEDLKPGDVFKGTRFIGDRKDLLLVVEEYDPKTGFVACFNLTKNHLIDVMSGYYVARVNVTITYTERYKQ
jgi:hypothetical protein